MDSSFTPIEQMLKFRASRHEDFPYQEILLTVFACTCKASCWRTAIKC